MLLAIDAGNTKTKWAVFSADGKILSTGACLNASLINTVLPLETVSSVLVSNVAGEAHAQSIQAALGNHQLQLDWLKSSAQCCNVSNQYKDPASLGTDRWASLIAAWHMQQSCCVVINAGTAITIDALIAGNNSMQAEFVGGMILPGLTLMQNSLGQATAQLPKNSEMHHANLAPVDIFAKATAQAISAGALFAALGAIEKMSASVQDITKKPPHIVISGGDAPIIKKHLAGTVTNQVIIVDNLVLSGLYIIHHKQSQ